MTISLNTYEEIKLEDIAEYGRAKEGYLYPRGTSTIQISATRGQVGYLEEAGYIKSKDVAIIPQAGINPKYFNIILNKNIAQFMNKYATGINIQEHDIGKFPVQLHNQETQHAIVTHVNQMEEKIGHEEAEIAALEKLKKSLMTQMFV